MKTIYRKKYSLNQLILLSLLSSVVFSLIYGLAGWNNKTVEYVLKAVGENFLNILQLLTIPLVILSIIISVNSAKDIKQFSQIGLITLLLYSITTFFAVILGLLIGNITQAGKLLKWLGGNLSGLKGLSPTLGPQVPAAEFLVPNNIFVLLSSNGNLVLIVTLSIVLGMALLRQEQEKKRTVLLLIESLHAMFMDVIHMAMWLAPIGIFGLITNALIHIIKENPENLASLTGVMVCYMGTVVLGLGIMLFVLYPMLVQNFSSIKYKTFLQAMYPAQMVAFSTSSSTIALPTTNRQVEKLGVSDKIRKFVLTLGASINMDGTSLYQAVSSIFLIQLFDGELSLHTQLYIVLYITISSIGIGGIPGASLIITSSLLAALVAQGILTEAQMGTGLALICVSDRILDMCRTATNITGDAAVAVLVGEFDKKNG